MITIYDAIIRRSRSGYYIYIDQFLIALDFTFSEPPSDDDLGSVKFAIEGKIVKSTTDNVFFNLIVKRYEK